MLMGFDCIGCFDELCCACFGLAGSGGDWWGSWWICSCDKSCPVGYEGCVCGRERCFGRHLFECWLHSIKGDHGWDLGVKDVTGDESSLSV